jgi:SAM-dependent methyltransferase
MAALRTRSVFDIGDYGLILVRNALGLPNRMPTPDRKTLEQVILPHYASRADVKTVLFVGCAWYTRHYQEIFPGRAYMTIDRDAWKRRFGSQRHIVADLEDLARHVEPGSVDLVVCNGVFGWGLDGRDNCERAFDACFDALRPAGELVIGWNDVAGHRPLDLGSLQALARFRPQRFEPLGSARYLANAQNRHVFNFYVKP